MVRICIRMLRISIVRRVWICIRMVATIFNVRICIRMLRISFEWLESLFNGSNLDSNASNLVWMVRICIPMVQILLNICIRMLRILLEGLEFALEWFKSLLTGSNLHSNASNFVRMLRISFECFEFRSNGSNLHSNVSNPLPMVRICIRMFRIPFQWFKFAFYVSNLVSIVWICIWMVRILFDWFEFAFKCFKSLSKGSNLHLIGSNPFRICIRMFWTSFKWF